MDLSSFISDINMNVYIILLIHIIHFGINSSKRCGRSIVSDNERTLIMKVLLFEWINYYVLARDLMYHVYNCSESFSYAMTIKAILRISIFLIKGLFFRLSY